MQIKTRHKLFPMGPGPDKREKPTRLRERRQRRRNAVKNRAAIAAIGGNVTPAYQRSTKPTKRERKTAAALVTGRISWDHVDANSKSMRVIARLVAERQSDGK